MTEIRVHRQSKTKLAACAAFVVLVVLSILIGAGEFSLLTIIDDPASALVLPIIALAEATFVVEKGRTAIPRVSDLMNDVDADSRIDIYPLTEEILATSFTLTAIPEIHDRLIAATGVYLQNQGEPVEILTKDHEIVLSSVLKVSW